jgi:hypothetical protein
MRWDAAEAEAALERIWDLHDRLSDAILAASRAHLLRPAPPAPPVPSAPFAKGTHRVGGGGRNGCVFVKSGGGGGGDALAAAAEAVAEARSLHAIRSALEDVEDHLEFLHVRLLLPFHPFCSPLGIEHPNPSSSRVSRGWQWELILVRTTASGANGDCFSELLSRVVLVIAGRCVQAIQA